jgi:2-desacetyl-2-hydroxyethyl bacteriochlorophyllide A dehydrogenase
MKSLDLVFEAPSHVGIHEKTMGELPPGALLVRTLLSAISAGTEMLFYRGLVPDGMISDPAIPSLQAAAYPLQYGYAAVGEVVTQGSRVEGEWEGKNVFSFQPHRSMFFAPPDELIPLPVGLSPEDAVFLPFMETAVNFFMDGAPLLDEKIAVFGLGVLGILTTALLARSAPRCLAGIDRFSLRRNTALAWGADLGIDPGLPESGACLRRIFSGGPYAGADLVYELTGDPSVLDQAVDLAGFTGRIIVGSWYGTRTAPLSLGADFHRKRCAIASSQVSTIQPLYSGRWNKERRRATALRMIEEMEPRRLITHRFPFADAATAYALIDRSPEDLLQTVLEY